MFDTVTTFFRTIKIKSARIRKRIKFDIHKIAIL